MICHPHHFTCHDGVAEKKLMKLIGKRGEQAPQGHHEAPDDGRDPGGLALANAHGEGRNQEAHRHRQRTEGAYKKKKESIIISCFQTILREIAAGRQFYICTLNLIGFLIP